MFSLRKKNFSKLDKPLIVIIAILLIYGLIVLRSAVDSLPGSYMKTQIIATLLGILLITIILCIDIDFIKSIYIPIYMFCNVLLIIVLFVGVGDEWGSRSWFSLGPINFQPAEIAKVGLIISLARFIELHKKNINEPLTLIKILLFAMLPVALILKQPDFGTAMVFVFFIAGMLFAAGLDFRYIFSAFILFLVSFPFFYMRLTTVQKDRIRNFLDKERDISNTGLQAWRGRIAIGSGRFSGQGYLQGTQSQFNFVLEKQTDYIYAVLVEELGFLGGALVILLYFLMFFRCIQIARNSESLFAKLIIVGFAAMLLFHIFENIGMTVGVMPITGIPLPFFSYGGTFQIINMICIGLVLSVSIQREPLSFM
ncbi:MAG: rod shape-determining protein RodA [Tissierellia bacterium]|nr:rod shape-determining protein RodA [Tissierellia bacterium]